MLLRSSSTILYTLLLIALCGCQDGVLTFPSPEPALLRIVNVTTNLNRARVTIDSTMLIEADRGLASPYTEVAAGRQLFVQVGSPQRVLRNNLKYTLGGGARVILFVRGDTTSLIEFRREIQDTVLPAGSQNSVVRFTHMAENVDKAYFVEIWLNGSQRLFPIEFEPGISSPSYYSIAPGTYSFEVREAGTTNVLARLTDVTIGSGSSKMLYTYNASAAIDDISLTLF
ncbi:MAG: DUF4397 domain-containing protein [Candidatus Kapabacteria bacterium]|nr:DUF4397 domain-containing protein [Candidatus Kapabacteria bacterium]